MPTVYISCSNRWAALYWKKFVEASGHVVTSTWHNFPMRPTADMSGAEKVVEADRTTEKIKESNFLLIIADPDKVPGGKFVDAGIALGNGNRVILVGRQENLKMFNSHILQCDIEDDVRRILANA